MSDKKIVFVLAILFIIPFVFASVDFTFYSSSSGMEDVCPRSTGLFMDVLENSGDEPLEFSISSAGSAAVFATSVPTGFVLMPGEMKHIYTYVTPMSSIDPGNYVLKLIANANGISKEIIHDVPVKDCYEYSFVKLDNEKNVCPCESDKFRFEVKNEGRYSEAYVLSVEGEYAGNVVLSQNSLTLSPGESKEIYAYVQSNCEDEGNYEFSVVIDPVNGNSVKSQTVKFNVDACYDFDIGTERDLVDMCEHSKEVVQIEVANEGSVTNVYNLEVDGPLWANLNKNELEIAPGDKKVVDLEFVPDYGVEGNFQVTFSATPERGSVKAVNVFNVNVKKCYDVFLSLEKNSDKICNSLENDYTVLVRNQGEFSKEFFVDVEGPEWVSLSENNIELDAGEEKELILKVAPGFDVSPEKYGIKVNVVAKDSSKVASSDSISIETVSRDICYKASLRVDEKNVKVYYDSSATVPIVVENLGADVASYSLSVSGTASNFVYLNPSVISVEPGKSEVVYLYIAPSSKVGSGEYGASVAVRLDDTTIMASENINILVTDSPADANIIESPDAGMESLWSKIVKFFAGLFGGNGEDIIIEDLEFNETSVELNESVEGVNESVEENVTEEIVEEEQEIIGELIGVDESVRFNVGEEEHSLRVNEIVGDTVLIELSSEKVYVQMSVGETRKVDLDGDGMEDVEIVFNGIKDGKADISYNVIERAEADEGVSGNGTINETEVISDVEDNGIESEKDGFFARFFSSLGFIFVSIFGWIGANIIKLVIVAVIIAFLVALVKTNLWQNLLKFFEEEIEEEEVRVRYDGKKEEKEQKEVIEKEPKKTEKEEEVEKKEKPKKKTKEGKKEEEKKEEKEEPIIEDGDEEDEFIIEFDDDD